jgi:hypothetical protein
MKVVTGDGADPADPSSSLVSYQDFYMLYSIPSTSYILSPLSPSTATLEIELQMRHQPGSPADKVPATSSSSPLFLL